jgi:gamma-glutamyl-gamma-aminobutyrate hydrolase PuuD
VIKIAITQRVSEHPELAEKRDGLDQRWLPFIDACGLLPILIPNDKKMAKSLIQELQPDGVLLTGGGDLTKYGGNYPERDQVERALLHYAMAENIPLVGVCRGMQAIQNLFGVPLESVDGHIAEEFEVLIDGKCFMVNSYHNLGSKITVDELAAWAVASDGIIMAIRHSNHPILGIMWHPERIDPFRHDDIQLIANYFKNPKNSENGYGS